MARSTIMDTNSYRAADAPTTSTEKQRLIRRREQLLGPSYRLFYSDPVHLLRGQGAHLYDVDGRQYLDMYNNVVSVGHAHPRVVEAVHQQMQLLNTHTRYLHEKVLDYAEDLLGTMPDEIGQVMFTCTGSEANDLAVRVANHYTGNRGVIVTAEAYHGNSALTSAASPALGSGTPLGPEVRVVPAPDRYRVAASDLGAWFAARIQEQVDDLERHGFGFSAFLADSLFSSDGVLPDPTGFLRPAIDTVHRNGGLFIADEVQPGFGRTGQAMWGFQLHGTRPDLVTTGKPMGNGIPVAAMAARPEILEPFGHEVPYFNTFGGNPVSIAAAQAVLDIIRDEDLVARNRTVGERLLQALRELQTEHEGVGDVRGAGLYLGVELVTDRAFKTPDRDRALAVINDLRRRGVLTSVAGPHGNVLKIRPPYAVDLPDVQRFVEALDQSLAATGRS